MSADHFRIIAVPTVITDCAPAAIETHFHSPRVVPISIYKSNVLIVAGGIWSCERERGRDRGTEEWREGRKDGGTKGQRNGGMTGGKEGSVREREGEREGERERV